MKNNPITYSQLAELRKIEDVQLIDVREQVEHEETNIGGDLIPLNTLLNNVEKISKDKKVVIYCRSGARSRKAIEMLEEKYGFKNLYNLEGGVVGMS